MRIAVAQFTATMDKTANLEHISNLTAEAAALGAGLVIFPEAAMCDFGRPDDDLHLMAESLEGPFVDGLRTLAVQQNVTVVSGMFELIPKNIAAYRKRHLFDAFGEVESERFRPGLEPALLFQLGDFTVGLAICYDLRFPAFIAEVADRGADLLVLPAAWVAGPMKEEHWTVLTRARAIENTMYIAAAGMTGAAYCGRSVIVDPLGVAEAALGERKGVIVADITRERLAEVRSRVPVVAQRRSAAASRPRGN